MLGKPVEKQPPQPTQTLSGTSRPTILGKTMRIVGEIVSEEELYIDGELEGTLELRNHLTIGPNSKVIANVKATEVVVFGSVRGNVEAINRISLRAGATMIGDIKTAGIIIDDGAYFKGGIDISRTETSKV
jgi:cytoskeletal protein CcmA (bactofilin family)